MAAPAATLSKIRYRLMDTAASNPLVTDATTLQAAVDNALAKYNRDRPLIVTEDETGAGSPYFVLVGTGALLAKWVDGFSVISRIEYPAATPSATHVPSYLIEGEDFEVGYRSADKSYLRCITVTPTASQTLRITYTARHTHDTNTDTVYTQDLEALYDLAAHFACVELATKAASANAPLIQADSASYRDAQLKYKQQADAWLAAYNDKMGIAAGASGSESGVRGGSARADWDSTMQSGYPLMTHWGRRR